MEPSAGSIVSMRGMFGGISAMVVAPSGEAGARNGRATVLVVEDEVIVRLATADALREAGYLVLEAATADEAKVLLMTFPGIAVVFSDIQMPGSMDGLTFQRFIRATFPSVRMVLTSGATTPSDCDEATIFVPKPYDPAQVAKRIQDLLG